MRLILQQDLELFDLEEEDYNRLKKCSVWINKIDSGLHLVYGQNIDLPPDDMEAVMDILDLHSEHVMKLIRYSNSRYSWDLYQDWKDEIIIKSR